MKIHAIVVIILTARRTKRIYNKYCLCLQSLITISFKRRTVDIVALTIFKREITFIKQTDFRFVTELRLSNNSFLKEFTQRISINYYYYYYGYNEVKMFKTIFFFFEN